MSHGHTSWWFKMFKGNPKVILKSFEVQTKALISSCWSQLGLQITLRIALNFRVPLANQVAYTCLLLEKFYGREHSHTQACANLLIRPGAMRNIHPCRTWDCDRLCVSGNLTTNMYIHTHIYIYMYIQYIYIYTYIYICIHLFYRYSILNPEQTSWNPLAPGALNAYIRQECPSAMVLPWDCTMMLRGMESQVARAFQTSVAEMLTLAMLATTIITIILATLLYQLLYWWSWSRSFRPINPLSPSWIPWSGIQPIPAPKIFISRLFVPSTGSTCTLGVVESFPVLMEKIKNPPRRNWTSCNWAGLGAFKKAMLEWVIRWKYWYRWKMATARMERWFGAPDWNCSNGLNVGVLPCFGDGCFFPRFGLHLTFFRIIPLSHLHSDMGA